MPHTRRGQMFAFLTPNLIHLLIESQCTIIQHFGPKFEFCTLSFLSNSYVKVLKLKFFFTLLM